MSRGDPGIDGLGQIAIVAKDVARATAFYRDVLRLPLLFEAPPGLAFFDCGGVRLMITLPSPGHDTQRMSSLLYYRVPSARAAYDTLVESGAEPVREPQLTHKTDSAELWIAFLNDTEGNTFGVMSEDPIEASEAG